MVEPMGSDSTCLYFGSAVVPSIDRASGKARMGFVFKALLGFHRIYSRVLLHAARSRLSRVWSSRIVLYEKRLAKFILGVGFRNAFCYGCAVAPQKRQRRTHGQGTRETR